MDITSSNSQPQIDEEMATRIQDIKKKFQDKENINDKITSNEDIIKNVNAIIKMKKNVEIRKFKVINRDKYMRTFIKKFETFHMNFPSIFNSVMDEDTFEVSRLKEMLEMRKKIQDNKISNFDACVEISNKYTNEFVKKPLNL